MELQRTQWFAGPSCKVHLFHRSRVFIIRLSIPLASFSCAPCIGKKNCTGLGVAPILRKFQLTAIRRIAANSVVCSLVLPGTLFAPIQGFNIWALNPLRFLFICTLHYCKHCTGLEEAPILRKFPPTALRGTAADAVVYRPVHIGTRFASKQGFNI